MSEPALSKQNAGKIGKTFALLFNRALMYDANHPSTKQTAGEFHKTISIGLNELTPIVFIMAQEQFFVEDEPLDPRINTGRMLSHFKNGGIQSVSFEKGIKENDLKTFSKIFFDATRYTNADAIKSALAKEGHRFVCYLGFSCHYESPGTLKRLRYDKPSAAATASVYVA